MKEVPRDIPCRSTHGFFDVVISVGGVVYLKADRSLHTQKEMLDLREDLADLGKWIEENADLLPVEVAP